MNAGTGSRWSAGQTFGPPEDADQYTLESLIRRDVGLEGETWRATRNYRDGGPCNLVAVKIKVEADAGLARKTVQRWTDSNDRVNGLGIPGLVIAHCFSGPLPGGAPGADRAIYQASPWQDAEPADRWAHAVRPGPALVATVLRELCRIVAALHDHGFLHRDLSAGNVLVAPDGSVRIIDLTWINPDGIRPSTLIRTKGYTAPEAHDGPTSASDRYSVGALCRRLLLPLAGELDAARTDDCRRELRRAGYPARVADLVAAMVDQDPSRRPGSLRSWGESVAQALTAPRRPERYHGLAVLAGAGDQATVVLAAGNDGVGVFASNSAGAAFPMEFFPDGVAEVAAVRGADGMPVVYGQAPDGAWSAVSDAGRVPLADSGHDARDEARYEARYEAGHDAGYGARYEAGHDAGHGAGYGARYEALVIPDSLPTFPAIISRKDPDSGVRLQPVPRHAAPTGLGQAGGPLLAGAFDAAGRPAALAVHEGRTVCLLPDGGRGVVLGQAAERAALVLNRMGELEAWLLLGDGGLVVVEQLAGRWYPDDADRPGLGLPPGARVADVAVVGHRGGPTVATAGSAGVWVHPPVAGRSGERASARLEETAADRVAAAMGRDWRLRVAALVGGAPRCWQEAYSGGWNPVDLFPATTRPPAPGRVPDWQSPAGATVRTSDR